MAETVQERRRELLVTEDLDPLAEGQIRREDRRATLVALSEQIEEQFGLGPGTNPNSSTMSSAVRW
jgi:hypothetical protein